MHQLSRMDQPGDPAPPHNIEAEQGLIAAVLLEPSTMLDIASAVAPGDFYRADHENAWKAILDVQAKGQEVNVVAVSEQLCQTGRYTPEEARGLLVELIESSPTHWHASYYADLVAMKSLSRRLVQLGREIIEDNHSHRFTGPELLERAERAVFALAMVGQRQTYVPVDEPIAEVIDRCHKPELRLHGVTTGLDSLDNLLGYILAQELVIIAARPSVGKSALALGVLRHIAQSTRLPVLFVSLEMSRQELAGRLLSQRSGVNGLKIKNPSKLSSDELHGLDVAAALLRDCNLLVDDAPAPTVAMIASKGRRIKARSGLAAICVDYLQLVTPAANGPRHEQVARMAREFKQLAQELDIPVFVLAQLNRESEAGRGGVTKPGEIKDHTPKLHHLRESGAIEQDANQVWLLHRPDQYDEKERPGQADLIVAKNRDGAKGVVPLRFLAKQVLFLTHGQDAPTTLQGDPGDMINDDHYHY